MTRREKTTLGRARNVTNEAGKKERERERERISFIIVEYFCHFYFPFRFCHMLYIIVNDDVLSMEM